MGKPRILLIDDDESLRKVISHHLLNEGYEVFLASCGEEGIDLFKKKKIDLIITDLKMPGMDGMEVLLAIKKMKEVGQNDHQAYFAQF